MHYNAGFIAISITGTSGEKADFHCVKLAMQESFGENRFSLEGFPLWRTKHDTGLERAQWSL